MKALIKLAETEAEREALFRYRYRVYVEEMGREQRHANHASRLIKEPLDGNNILHAPCQKLCAGVFFEREREVCCCPK